MLNLKKDKTRTSVKYNLLKEKYRNLSKKYIGINRQLKKHTIDNNEATSFFANLNHNIRTPINIITGACYLLKENNNGDIKKHGLIDIITKNSIFLVSTIENLIDISEMKSDIHINNTESVNINYLMSELYSYFIDININNNQLNINFGQTDLIFITNEMYLRKILFNIIENAVKFTENGIIYIHSYINENQLFFRIKDSGIGIPKQKQEFIFEPFVRIAENNGRVYNGLGLGLTVSKYYTDLLNGKISINSNKDKGTTFLISFPYNN